jgi:hypothetical protein
VEASTLHLPRQLLRECSERYRRCRQADGAGFEHRFGKRCVGSDEACGCIKGDDELLDVEGTYLAGDPPGAGGDIIGLREGVELSAGRGVAEDGARRYSFIIKAPGEGGLERDRSGVSSGNPASRLLREQREYATGPLYPGSTRRSFKRRGWRCA